MEFKEEFPSLDGKEYEKVLGERIFFQKTIIQNCLDKQKVREAIEKHKFNDEFGVIFIEIKDLEKELNL